jgi:hypothetical protein
MKTAIHKTMLENFIGLFSRSRSYGIGVLDENVEAPRSGFSQTVLEERRQSSRVAISVPVWYRVKNGWAKWLLGKSVDHSGTGIRLALPPGVKAGTEISLRMKLPDAKNPIDIKGVVVWVEPLSGEINQRTTVECGVAFQDIRTVANKESLVYLIANKILKIGLNFTRNLAVAPAQSIEELKACYSIVYRGYVARRYCLPNDVKMHYHYYSFLPESRTFALKDKDKLLGTISVVVDSPCGLPMDSLFQREIDHLRGQGKKLAEVSLLAMAPDENKRKIFSLTDFDKQVRLFCLFKMMYEYAANVAGVTDLIIGVHPKHETLYKYLTFKAMGSPKDYPGARGNPALPMHLDIVWAKESWSTCLRTFFLSEPAPMATVRGGIKMNADLVRKFLCEDLDVWNQIPPKAQKFLKESYPGTGPRSKNPLFNLFNN